MKRWPPLPTAQPQGLKGGIKYWDGQFDDARLALALALARTAASHGALLVNYSRAVDLLYDAGKVAGLVCEDIQTGQSCRLKARCVINAAGVWVDALRQQDGVASGAVESTSVVLIVAPSQGVHLVVDREFLAADVALMVPHTADGRVLFAVPWLGKVILGTTDRPTDTPRRAMTWRVSLCRSRKRSISFCAKRHVIYGVPRAGRTSRVFGSGCVPWSSRPTRWVSKPRV